MKTVTVGVRMPQEMKQRLQEMADKEMRSLSNMALKILRDRLEAYEREKAK